MRFLRNLIKRRSRANSDQNLAKRPATPKVSISCVVADHPRFRIQAWNWLLSLAALETQCRVFVHYLPGALSQTVQAEFLSLGATLIEVAPFGEGPARYCNKIRQLETRQLLDADFVILSDTDIAFLQDPALLVRADRFRAKTVDAPNPPKPLWSELFARAHLAERVRETPLEMEPATQTFATNFNGGLYVIPVAMARTLLPLWHKHAAFCLQQQDLLGDYLRNSDQLGMGLALAESGLPIDPLPTGANLPTHFPKEELARIPAQEVASLHYHEHVDIHGMPCQTGVDWIDAAIVRMNGILTSERRKRFSNEIFWDFRYAHFPELGSGLGSRNEVLAHKQGLLSPYIEMIGEGSILDVGCGDLEVFAPLPAVNYTGVDVSEQALSIARLKRPDWTFELRSVADFASSSFDYTISLDVLIHQSSEASAKEFLHHLVRVARKGIIFSVHSKEIEASGISFNSSALKNDVVAMPEISALHEIGSYRDVTLYLAEKGLGERHTAHDIGLQELALGARFSGDKERLKELVDFSRKTIGFFPRTVIRTHEYPWFANHIPDCAGKRVLDVGAGVCCLPFYLAERGAHVTTVDSHAVRRIGQPPETWNEWGFLDYSAFDPRIRSMNVDMRDVDDGEKYDIVYSVSVLEHMPATVRRDVIAKVSCLLRPQGRLLLSVDMIPGTDLLWNYSEGRVVEDTETHGNLNDIKSELSAVGLTVVLEDSLTGVPMQRTEVAYLVCDKVVADQHSPSLLIE
jgi:2-polyprenyl-3-methyl-5-hydroxy-6-metoxy-1,4-benzoquinol methylase